MPVCKDCGKHFGDGAYIYHECKSGLRAVIDNCLVNPAELRNEIADLRSAKAELKRQLEERTEQLRKEYLSAIDWAGEHQEAIEKLTESQASEARLREALVNIANARSLAVEMDSEWCPAATGMVRLAKEALTLLHDDTAIKEYRNRVIEECAVICDGDSNYDDMTGSDCAKLLREMKVM